MASRSSQVTAVRAFSTSSASATSTTNVIGGSDVTTVSPAADRRSTAASTTPDKLSVRRPFSTATLPESSSVSSRTRSR
ncbi:hypothetical protein [Aeromicrobium sp. UC242_57]|uniref:hypothetical protein n=1 Tax=Aeromicrobium sp. UC242_57 TaxID=3374624 RepID=UPI0037BB524C